MKYDTSRRGTPGRRSVDTAEHLVDRIRAAQATAVDMRRLMDGINASLEAVEDALHEKRAKLEAAPLGNGSLLQWDGELLWVINRDGKHRVTQCSRAIRLEVVDALGVLLERMGLLYA